MNPARTFGPDLVGTDFRATGSTSPDALVGAALAVGAAWVLRGAGGGRTGSAAAQGDIQTEVEHPEKEAGSSENIASAALRSRAMFGCSGWAASAPQADEFLPFVRLRPFMRRRRRPASSQE